MAINLLPLEVLQEILSYLPYYGLMDASLVCRRWNQASETFIVRNGQLRIDKEVVRHLDVIRKSSTLRNYQAFSIGRRMNDWQQLQPVVSECIQKFPRARELCLTDIAQDYLDRFYQVYRDWMGTLESLEVSLDDTYKDLYPGEEKDYILELPNLKKLCWKERLNGFAQKIVTIDAPRLEEVYFEDSFDYTSELRITHGERIKHIKCTFFKKQFEQVFQHDPLNVESLILNVLQNESYVHCLSDMHRLRYLSLYIGRYTNYLLQVVEAMENSKLLKVLIICAGCRDSDRGTLNLKQIFGNFDNLEKLDLSGINLASAEEIHADQLVFLKIYHITCLRSILELNAPKLKTLALTVEMLGKLHLNNNEQLTELYLDLESTNLMESFDQIVLPFITERQHITLVLMRFLHGYEDEDQVMIDDVINDRIVESVEHLVLHGLRVGIAFFRSLAGWTSLKSLELVDCTINCSEMTNDVFRLPGVERIIIESVKVRGTLRTDFPIILVDGANEEIVGDWDFWTKEPSTLVFSTRNLIRKLSTFQEFDCPEVDPLLQHWLL